MKLKLEINQRMVNERMDVRSGALPDPNVIRTLGGSSAIISPWGGPDNWLFRVMVSKKQAVIGFRKHLTIGIGFMNEANENTNLPFETKHDIFEHIKENKADALDDDCIRAIEMIKRAAAKWMKFERACREEQVMQRFPELRGVDGKLIGLAGFRKRCKVVKVKYDDLHIFLGDNQDGTWKYRFAAQRELHVRDAVKRLYDFMQSYALYNVTFSTALGKGLCGLNFSYNGPIPKDVWCNRPHGLQS